MLHCGVYGSHLSIAGGMHLAVEKMVELRLSALQVFTKNQQQWKVRPLDGGAVRQFREAADAAGLGRIVSHASYLINVASPDAQLRKKSEDLLLEEVRRCDLLGIDYLVMHPGAHVGQGEAVGLKRVAASLGKILRQAGTRSTTTVCLESTAGSGSNLGWHLDHLGGIIELCKAGDRLGVCLDTAHLFAAGYDFRGRRYAQFKRDCDAAFGLDRIKVWHLNDSKKDVGSRVDRHEHIGRGTIGDEGFRPIVRDRLWRETPKILETPKGKTEAGVPWDRVNVERLESLARPTAKPTARPRRNAS